MGRRLLFALGRNEMGEKFENQFLSVCQVDWKVETYRAGKEKVLAYRKSLE